MSVRIFNVDVLSGWKVIVKCKVLFLLISSEYLRISDNLVLITRSTYLIVERKIPIEYMLKYKPLIFLLYNFYKILNLAWN